MSWPRIRKYKNTKGYKIQILSSYSVFPINGGTKEGTRIERNYLTDEAKGIVKKEGIQYYVIENYTEPMYGLVGVNLRVFDTKEIYDNYLKAKKRSEARAKREHEKYLIQKAAADKLEAEVEKEDKELIKKLYSSSRIKNLDKVQVNLPHYDGMRKHYWDRLEVTVGSEEIEKVLATIKETPTERHEKIILGKDYLDYKLVNKIVAWLNKHTNKFKFKPVKKTYRVRLPMAYCCRDKEKYPYDSKQYWEVCRKLTGYDAVAFDVDWD